MQNLYLLCNVNALIRHQPWFIVTFLLSTSNICGERAEFIRVRYGNRHRYTRLWNMTHIWFGISENKIAKCQRHQTSTSVSNNENKKKCYIPRKENHLIWLAEELAAFFCSSGFYTFSISVTNANRILSWQQCDFGKNNRCQIQLWILMILTRAFFLLVFCFNLLPLSTLRIVCSIKMNSKRRCLS